jgi:hypothetical protein
VKRTTYHSPLGRRTYTTILWNQMDLFWK